MAAEYQETSDSRERESRIGSVLPTRRDLMRSALAVAAVSAAQRRILPAQSKKPDSQRLAIPGDFLGLGYEMSSVAKPGLLRACNAPMIELLRNLGRRGVLRVGGIVADYTRYAANEAAVATPKNTVINRENLRQLRGFLDAVGWSVLWSVNFGSGRLEEAVVEAQEVHQVLGSRLNAIELGNEVENYGRGERPLRKPSYSYETYRAEYDRWRTAIQAAVPGVRFAGPDTAASVDWVERMAADAHGDVQLLTTHYYRGDQRQGTRTELLQDDPDLIARLERLQKASRTSGIPWRMCETNSYFGGGRPGVSDTLAGALWTIDFMMLLARYGCAGVNLETGENQLGFVSSYSPIPEDAAGHNSAGAPYYGMLAFATAVSDARDVFPVDRAGTKLRVYALGAGGRVRSVTLINKATEGSMTYPLRSFSLRAPTVFALTGPSLDSKAAISFGGAMVEASGRWSGRPQPLHGDEVVVRAGSALVVRSA